MSKLQKIKIATPIIIFNIILPTLDILTDFIMVVKLFLGAYKCNNDNSPESEAFQQCQNVGPGQFCGTFLPNISTNMEVIRENNQTINASDIMVTCKISTHPVFAVGMFLPFIINYLSHFYLWKIGGGSKVSIILPMLNIYPQFGKN